MLEDVFSVECIFDLSFQDFLFSEVFFFVSRDLTLLFERRHLNNLQKRIFNSKVAQDVLLWLLVGFRNLEVIAPLVFFFLESVLSRALLSYSVSCFFKGRRKCFLFSAATKGIKIA